MSKENFALFVEDVNKADFPIPIDEFVEMLKTLSPDTYIWYTYSFNPFHLVQVQQFVWNHIPKNALKVYRKGSDYMRVLPNIFSHQIVFFINTTAENVCVLAISDET